jgi:putative PIN family toxin of toxin-antitoxin system
MEEFMEVVRRPKFEKYFGEDDISELLSLFEYYGHLVSVDSTVAVCRDHKDNFLLALAKDGVADYLITGDKDLLDVGTFEGTRILSFNAFVDKEKK